MSARFITLEGLDGAGKTTHLEFIRGWLAGRGVDFVSTREPGGTPLGETLRELVLREAMHADTELLLMFAARREHVAQLIDPALRAGRWVLCDRFVDATYAYQGGGRGLDSARIAALEALTLNGMKPDLTLLLDVPLHVSQERLARSRETDRFEREAAAFHERVRAVYLQRAAAEPGRFTVIDAARPLDAVQLDIAAALEKTLA